MKYKAKIFQKIIRIKIRHTSKSPRIDCKKQFMQGVIFMKDYIEERAVEIACYITEYKATVRQTAKEFGVCKSTIRIDIIKWNGL